MPDSIKKPTGKKSAPFRKDLQPLDNLFGVEPEAEQDTLILLPLNQLHPFKDHPFRIYNEAKMADMVNSIKEHGVMSPLIVRSDKDGSGYEIICGHNRHEGARQAELREVPAIIRELDDATAILMMISSNFEQRDQILPSEKAFAYKMQLEAIKRQGERTDLTSVQVGQKLTSREEVSQTTNDSSVQIHRYVRLTELAPSLLERVDNDRLPFVAAVELSYLTKEQQATLDELMTCDGLNNISIAQAAKLKEKSQDGTLDDISMVKILSEKPEPLLSSVKISKRLQDYIPKDTLPKDAEERIIGAFELQKTVRTYFPENMSEKDMADTLHRALSLYNDTVMGSEVIRPQESVEARENMEPELPDGNDMEI